MKFDDNIPIPSVQRGSPNRITQPLQNLIDRYNVAHKALYGVPITITWEKPWFRVAGQRERVSRKRLLEMTRQLEYRTK